MAVAKKKKNKPVQESAGAALDEIESRGDALSEWISENPVPIMGTVGAILLGAAVFGFATSGINNSTLVASSDIASAKNEFRQAMGGAYSGTLDIPELANADAARSTREEYLARFEQVATEHAGSDLGGYALMQVASLQADLENYDAAIAGFEQAAATYDADAPMLGIVYERIALLQEQTGDLDAAAASHMKASDITAYPLRYFALLNAARVQAEAGNTNEAIAHFDRITTESPDLLIPEHTQSLLLELKAQQAL